MTLSLTAAAHRILVASPATAALISAGDIGTGTDTGPWIFRGLNDTGAPYRNPEGTGKSAIVISQRAAWASANRHNTMRFPRLQFLIFSDRDRTAAGLPITRGADDRARRIGDMIFSTFHDTANRRPYWPDEADPERIRVVACVSQSGDAEITDVPGGDGSVRAEINFEVTLG